jgi:hypothetical protein
MFTQVWHHILLGVALKAGNWFIFSVRIGQAESFSSRRYESIQWWCDPLFGIGVLMDRLRRAVPSIPNSRSRAEDGGTHPHIAFQKMTRPAQFASNFNFKIPKLMEFYERGVRNLSI